MAQQQRTSRGRLMHWGCPALCLCWLLLCASTTTVVLVDADSDDASSSGWQQWLEENKEKLRHHQKNVERALEHIKNALQEQERVEKDEQAALLGKLWEQQGRRMAVLEPKIESALEVRPTGEVSEMLPAFMQTERHCESQDPFAGMILHVRHESFARSPGIEMQDGDSAVDSYQLVEPLELELGTVPKHHVDYAYKPVGTLGSGHSLTLKPDSTLSLLTESAWWQWWFKFMGFRAKTNKQRGDSYDRMGERAFAGGSHGEVWRGRRRCPKTGHSLSSARSVCDETKPLILKRLKIENGLTVLEAGLREIYLGNLMAQETGTQELFTVYLDHFFRETSVPSFVGRRGKTKELDLWIVFEDAGPSLRSYLYSPIPAGAFVVHQNSPFWTSLRMSTFNTTGVEGNKDDHSLGGRRSHNGEVGRALMKHVLKQIVQSAAYLHDRGIVHRDIKPSNVMCKSNGSANSNALDLDLSQVHCVLGDFSSMWDSFADQNLYSNGPSSAEQTIEYAPPEALVSPKWVPFHPKKPESYDSWSIGVLALELLLGTPHVFSVDQRTTALLTNKMQKQGASEHDIQRALYLAALSQFCIYMPSPETDKSWPLRDGDPLHNAAMIKQSCTLRDFHRALRARDPLGIGFDSATDPLLHLVWKLLALDPMDRITASEALQHPYFTVIDLKHSADLDTEENPKALESLMLDPRMDMPILELPEEFVCPKCNRTFADWQSCQAHATKRKHAKFCDYNRTMLPTCLNAHSMLPAHPTSGYCDIQGRRPTIEDFHSVHLHTTHQFYGVFDGHTGNLASKYAASMLYQEVSRQLVDLAELMQTQDNWKEQVQSSMADAFETIHTDFLRAVASVPAGTMDQSGTTATFAYVTEGAIVVASVGDSRAIMSSLDSSSSDLRAVALTIDHTASHPVERDLVLKRGGVVESGGTLPRVNGTLAITRSIGDERLSSLLSREPHVVSMTRSEFKSACAHSSIAPIEGEMLPCFLVIASDGLWDVMNNQEAVDMVAQVIATYDNEHGIGWEEGGAFQEAAERLTQEAFVRGSTDNIGVCVIAVD